MSDFLLHIRSNKLLYAILLLCVIVYFFSLSKTLFKKDYSTVVLDEQGELLGARIANDGQWRFPEDSVVPDKFKNCIVTFEDRFFFRHPGFNPVSFWHALKRNIKAGKVVSGGSTITMQVIRLYRNGKDRTVPEKILEILLATRLELRYSKNDILKLYASHAPFGGNVVGVGAASWRFFGRPSTRLSWAENALLAVLPNSPSSMHPGRNRDALLKKRNTLLATLKKNHFINDQTYLLSIEEPLPQKPLALPDLCPQITEDIKAKTPGKIVTTTLKYAIQSNLNRIVYDYYNQLKINKIQNACAVIIEVKTGHIIGYCANIPKENVTVDGQDVDLIISPRSTGSILKPMLYAGMQDDGLILPTTLVPDIPTLIDGFKPENYDLNYDGAVTAKKALSRSLNVPCVRMLQMYGIPKFEHLLQKVGLTTLTFSPDHYGLTLIVGGAEGKLLEISSVYAHMAEILNEYNAHNSLPDYLAPIDWLKHSGHTSVSLNSFPGPGAIWLTFKALLEVNRPDEESGWAELSSSRNIAWKTGTSYGFRDAWAIGTTPEYVVGVWAGNANGEGRPGLTGAGTSGPLLFRIYSSLPSTSWFSPPYDDLEKVQICRLSGYKAGPYCDVTDTVFVARRGIYTELCPYHKRVFLSSDRKYRVNMQCYDPSKIIHENWFVLPPAMEWFYRKRNVLYSALPPVMPGCIDDGEIPVMELIYPTEVSRIFIPRELDGTIGKTIFEIAHRNPNATIYWHIDDNYMGSTHGTHQMAFVPSPGSHVLTAVDQDGRTITRRFEVVDR